MKPIALITGATSGIGEACARTFASKFFLILCGRRSDRLAKLESELKVFTDILTLSFDVRDQKAIVENFQNLPEAWKDIDLLINNAGNAHGRDHVQDGSLEDWEAMIDINLKGLLYMTREIVPGMVQRKKGHIINIGSVAGIDIYPQGNVYCATKSAVDMLSKGMRMDLLEHNVKVSEIKPGLVETEFSEVRFKGDQDKAKKVYEGFEPLTASDVADVIYFMATRPSHVNLADILILPTAQANSTMVHKQEN